MPAIPSLTRPSSCRPARKTGRYSKVSRKSYRWSGVASGFGWGILFGGHVWGFHQAEVSHFHNALRVEHEIVGLHIAVNHAAIVREFDPRAACRI